MHPSCLCWACSHQRQESGTPECHLTATSTARTHSMGTGTSSAVPESPGSSRDQDLGIEGALRLHGGDRGPKHGASLCNVLEPTLRVAGGVWARCNCPAGQAQALKHSSGMTCLGSSPFSSTRPLPGLERSVKPRGNGTVRPSTSPGGLCVLGLLSGKQGGSLLLSVFFPKLRALSARISYFVNHILCAF